MKTLFLIIWITIILLLIIHYVLMLKSKLYYAFIYEHKRYKLWKNILKNKHKIKYDYSFLNAHHFTLSDTDYYIIIWKDGTIGVFYSGECVATNYLFEKYADILHNYLTNKYNNAYTFIKETKNTSE